VSAGALLEIVPARRLDPAARARLARQARVLAYGGIAWHVVEFAIALGAGLAASSIALVGFGVDSLIEALAGGVVLLLFAARRASSPSAERRAQQLIAASFFLLAGYIGVEALHALVVGDQPGASWVGIGLAAVTAPTMPLLARAKTRLARQLGSAAAVSEGAQTMLCAYLSIALLVGLGANAIAGWWWADPLAALAIAGVAVREGFQGLKGDSCCAPVETRCDHGTPRPAPSAGGPREGPASRRSRCTS
jgi:divalent metal cation (Fe/Co/Zn/Cd) transporter